MHLDTSHLRAYLDQALPETEQAAAAAHLAACGACRSALGELEARAIRVQARLTALAPAPDEAARAAPAAWKALSNRKRKDSFPMLKSLAQRRLVWVGAAVLALALSLSFAPMRTFAGQFLGLFRVNQIAVLPVDMARLESLYDDPTLTDQLNLLFADSLTVIKEPDRLVTVASAEEASALVGFPVRQLGGQASTPSFTVQQGAAFEVTIDQPGAQALLNEAGRGDLVLPASLDGAVIAVDIPAGVNLAYNCPQPTEVEFDPDGPGRRSRFGEARDCVLLGQIPSPSVETPPNLDIVELAELALQFTGMSPEEASAFSGNVDWTSTLVVPIPLEDSVAKQVQVDGVTGTLVTGRSHDGSPQRYTLMWVKDGIVYALSAFGTADEAVALANTIR